MSDNLFEKIGIVASATAHGIVDDLGNPILLQREALRVARAYKGQLEEDLINEEAILATEQRRLAGMESEIQVHYSHMDLLLQDGDESNDYLAEPLGAKIDEVQANIKEQIRLIEIAKNDVAYAIKAITQQDLAIEELTNELNRLETENQQAIETISAKGFPEDAPQSTSQLLLAQQAAKQARVKALIKERRAYLEEQSLANTDTKPLPVIKDE